MSVTTFAKVNAVVVDQSFSQVHDAAIDAGFATGGAFAANLAPAGAELSQTASVGTCAKGMPAAINASTGTIQPIAQASSSTQARFGGVLTSDISPARAATPRRLALIRRGRVRSYAAAVLNSGDPVKADTSGAFSGFAKWVAGTDSADLLVGYAYPLTDGIAVNQGDTIFVDLV